MTSMNTNDFQVNDNVEHIKKHMAGTVHSIAKDVIKVAFLGPKPNTKEPAPVIYENCKPEELRKI
jgi:hypothetical protein